MRIYLDQNKWFDISRAFYGREDGKPYIEILDKIEKSVREGKAIFPLSSLHFLESAKDQHTERKERFAKFLYKITNGFAILPYNVLIEGEVFNTVVQRLGQPEKMVNVAQSAIDQKGLMYAMGNTIQLPEEYEKLKSTIENKTMNEDFFVEAIVKLIDKGALMKMTANDSKDLAELESQRKELIKLDKDTAFFYVVKDYLKSFVFPEMRKCSISLGFNYEDFMKNHISDREKMLQFVSDIPCVNIFSNLSFQRDFELKRKIQINDIFDISFLTGALPYCDIVVTEGFWKTKIQNSNLDIKYGSQIFDDIRELKNALERL